MISPAAIVMTALLAMAPHGRARPAPAPEPPRPVSRPNPVNAASDLNAAVVRPQAGSLEDTPAALRDHERRTEEALDPSNPANTAAYRTSGPGCEPGNGALLSCGTNRQVSSRPSSPTSTMRDQTPDTDLMGRPR